MPAPITSPVYQIDFAARFRDRWAGRMANDGEVRDIGGFQIDVSGTPTRGQETYRSTITPGAGSTTYDPERPPHAPPPLETGLPSSSLMILQGNFQDQFKAAQSAGAETQGAAGDNPYAASMPAWVDIQHHETTRPEEIISVGYFVDASDAASQREFTMAQVDRLKALAEIERDLGAEFGEPVKLAWDGASGEFMMLRPGQAGYDDIQSANDLLRDLPKHLKQLKLFTAEEIDRMTA